MLHKLRRRKEERRNEFTLQGEKNEERGRDEKKKDNKVTSVDPVSLQGNFVRYGRNGGGE